MQMHGNSQSCLWLNPSEPGERLCRSGQAGGAVLVAWEGQPQGRSLVHILFHSHVSSCSAFGFLPLMPVCWPQGGWRPCGYLGVRLDWYHSRSGKCIRLKRESGRYNGALLLEPQSWYQVLLKEAQSAALFPIYAAHQGLFMEKSSGRRQLDSFLPYQVCVQCFRSGRLFGELCLAASWIVFQKRSFGI